MNTVETAGEIIVDSQVFLDSQVANHLPNDFRSQKYIYIYFLMD